MGVSIEADLDRIASLVKAKDGKALVGEALDGTGILARAAVLGLAKVGKDGAKLLTAALGSDDAGERARAARALGDLGDKSAAKAVGALLGDDAAAVRARALEALGRLEATAQAKAIAPLLDDGSADVRRAAATALGDLGADAQAAALTARLGDASSTVRRAVVRALQAIGAGAFVEALIDAARDEDESVQVAAYEALVGLQDEALLEPLFEGLAHPSDNVRFAAARAIAALDAAGDRVVDLLHNRSVQVRRTALEAIAARKITAGVRAVMDALRDGPEADIRVVAAHTLGALGDREPVERLSKALIDDDADLQEAAEEALRAILGKEADPDKLRADGHIALERWDRLPALGRAALDPLLRVLGNRTSNPRNVAARCGAARALGALGHKGAVKALLEALGEPAPRLRVAAAEALGAIGDSAAIPGLVEAAADKSPQVRAAVMQTLGQLGTDDVIDALAAAVTDGEPGVRRAALRAAKGLSPAAVRVAERGLSAVDAEERILAMEALAALATAEAMDLLHGTLMAGDSATRTAGRRLLVEAGWYPVGVRSRRTDAGFARWTTYAEWAGEAAAADVDQVKLLADALGDDNATRRRAAAEALGDLGDERAVAPLEKLMKSGDVDDQAVAAAALVALGQPEGEGAAWGPYQVAMHRWEAVEAIGKAAMHALASEMRHPLARVRVEVLQTAAAIGGPEAVEVIMASWTDPEDAVRDAVHEALRSMAEDDVAAGVRALPAELAVPAVRALAGSAAANMPPPERRLAVRLLDERHEEEATLALRAAIEADDAEVHVVALEALARRKDEPVVPLIEELIGRTPEHTVQVAAVKALLAIVGDDAVEPASALLLSDHPPVRDGVDAALKAHLGKKYDRQALEASRLADLARFDRLAGYGDKAVEPLRRVLADPDRSTEGRRRRSAAVRALASAVGEKAVGDLMAAAADDDAAVRAAACEALADVTDPAVVQAVRARLADGVETVRVQAATAVANLDGPGAAEALAPLLEDHDPHVVVAAVEGLVRLGEEAVPVLIAAMEGATSSFARRGAMRALAQLGDVRACDPLIAQLAGADPADREAARRALIACRWTPVGFRQHRTSPGYARWTQRSEWLADGEDRPQVEALVDALGKDPDPARRRSAAEALGEIGHDSAAPALLARLEGDDDVDVRMVASQSLVALGTSAERTPLWAPFWAASGQWDTCVALGAPSVGPLTSMLGEQMPRVRLGAAEALGAIGTPEALAALEAVADDSDARVRGAVARLRGAQEDPG